MPLKLAPTLVPAAELAGRLLGEAGELRRASRIIEKAWAANPHPGSRRHLRASAPGRFRAASGWRACSRWRLRRRPGRAHIESALAVARAALDAQEFAVARNAIAAAAEGADAARRHLDGRDRAARERRRGPRPRMDGAGACARRAIRQWSADGFVSDRWMPVSPVSGRLDAFQWKVPLAELGDAREVIEARRAGRPTSRRSS